ncbi:MAG TPA: adenylyl-sulfate kinase [Candidatus Acidoferrales bacterium]|nr:adenylyl-sulfate kinase [Candidatus Acidoferrales bacterium]
MSAARRGAVVFLTGLSGAGKSTIANALVAALRSAGETDVSLLDGDEVRRHLSSDLGFDPASREANVDRVAHVAAGIAARGGIAVTALIAPFESGRRRARELVEPAGAFVLVHVHAPLAVVEARDVKGLYARARAGEIPDFTGISSPFEAPMAAEVVIDTTTTPVHEAVARIRSALELARSGLPKA